MKHIVHIIFFVAGASVGIWWGVNHPGQAANLANNEQIKIQQAVAIAKKQVLEKVVNDQSSDPKTATGNHLGEYKAMLNTADADYNDAKAKIGPP